MRPINLIPLEERRSHGGGTRSGPLAYIVVGSLAVLLIGVVALVLTSNQISDREGEVAKLEVQQSAAAARANRLAPYTSFEQVALQRTQAVAELADSRFDWPRVIRQLSRVLPPRVYFEGMSGSSGGEAGGEGAAVGVTGPSLTLEGCAPGQDNVAAFVAALKEIDGVTRVGLGNSTIASSAAASDKGEGGGICAIGKKAQFEIVIAFDAAPASPDSAEAVAAEAATEATATEADEATAATTSTPEAAG
jgi:Tfp pilus assembly protein PilN